MRKPGTEKVRFPRRNNLRLSLQSTQSRRMDEAVVIAFESSPVVIVVAVFMTTGDVVRRISLRRCGRAFGWLRHAADDAWQSASGHPSRGKRVRGLALPLALCGASHAFERSVR